MSRTSQRALRAVDAGTFRFGVSPSRYIQRQWRRSGQATGHNENARLPAQAARLGEADARDVSAYVMNTPPVLDQVARSLGALHQRHSQRRSPKRPPSMSREGTRTRAALRVASASHRRRHSSGSGLLESHVRPPTSEYCPRQRTRKWAGAKRTEGREGIPSRQKKREHGVAYSPSGSGHLAKEGSGSGCG